MRARSYADWDKRDMKLNRDVKQTPAPINHKYIEAVTVCVNYGDFLAHTILWNKAIFDKWIIVTSPVDIHTRRLCEFHNVECVLTNTFFDDGVIINKAKGINVGFNRLRGTDWVLHIDADMVLPPLFRHTIDKIDLDTEVLYGIDRMMCYNRKDWDKFIEDPIIQMEAGVFVHFEPFHLSPRVYQPERGGYVPIGFFQLFHSSAKALGGKLEYPDTTSGVDRTDMEFALKWPGSLRRLLPEFVAIHLSTSNVGSANWEGRRTAKF